MSDQAAASMQPTNMTNTAKVVTTPHSRETCLQSEIELLYDWQIIENAPYANRVNMRFKQAKKKPPNWAASQFVISY